MANRMKTGLFKRLAREERGQVFIMVLALLVLGGLVIPPLLGFTGTGIKTGEIYERKTNELYAADAGIEDGVWQIKHYDMVEDDDYRFPGYGPYAYYEQNPSNSWTYALSDEVGELNDKDVQVTIENEWLPKDISVPSEYEASAIVEDGRLIVTDAIINSVEIPDTSLWDVTCRLRISYYKADQAELPIEINEIGVWLSPGFEYITESSSLEADPFVLSYPDSVTITNPYKGGEAVEWNYTGSEIITDFGPETSDQPQVIEVTFHCTGPSGRNPTTVSWVRTSVIPFASYSYNYSWDADVKLYKISSTAGDTTLESYTAKTELRQMSGAIAGDYYATGNSLLGGNATYRDELHQESSATVDTGDIPESAQIEAAFLYWSGWIDFIGYEPSTGGDTVVFNENCNNFTSPPVNWSAGSRWTIYNGDEFRGQGTGTSGDRTVTMNNSVNLSAHTGKTVTVSWSQREAQGGWNQSLEADDTLYFAFSGDGGGTWSSNIEAFHDDIGSSPITFNYGIPAQYITNNFRMRFYLDFDSSDEYAYINNISITVSNAIFSEDCANFTSPPVNWTNSNDWSVSSGTFRGHYISGNRYLTTASSLNLTAYVGETLEVSWQQWENGDLEDSDRLYYAFSGNGGASWSSNIEAFRNDIGSSHQAYSEPIPSEYLTNNFRLRFYLESFGASDEYCFVDNILISEGVATLEYPDDPTNENLTTLIEETARVNQVKFGSTLDNTVAVTADEWHVLESVNPPGYSMFEGQWAYSCYKDVTNLVQGWIETEDITVNGLGTYTLGHVVAANEQDPSYSFSFVGGGETGYPLATPAPDSPSDQHQACYAGWSLILIYSSPETKGHQLFLYDNFMYAWHSDPDFDGDGQPGGIIGGFLVPDSDPGETVAAQVTAFVGEGDSSISGDYFRVNDTNLSNASSPAGNVWNSNSPGLAIPGVDIDTFSIFWESDILVPQDTQADVNLPTDSDGFNAVYIILSFRSVTTTGGMLGYLIRD